MSRVAILSALPEEFDQIARSARIAESARVGDVEFVSGELEGLPVVLALSGMGKVNAAFAAAVMLDRYKCQAVIFSGVAGALSPQLEVGDVLIASRLVQHDYGTLVDGDFWPAEPGALPTPGPMSQHRGYALPVAVAREFDALAGEVQLPVFATSTGDRQPRVRLGTILTGDIFLSCLKTREALRNLHGGDAIEMEGAAVAQIAAKFNVLCITIRTISDAASKDSHTDFAGLVQIAAANSAALTRVMLPLVARHLQQS